MKGQIEKVKQLRAVFLEYSDGSVIAVPEDKALRVGTAFMRVIGQQELDWQVVKLGQPSSLEKLKKFFAI